LSDPDVVFSHHKILRFSGVDDVRNGIRLSKTLQGYVALRQHFVKVSQRGNFFKSSRMYGAAAYKLWNCDSNTFHHKLQSYYECHYQVILSRESSKRPIRDPSGSERAACQWEGVWQVKPDVSVGPNTSMTFEIWRFARADALSSLEFLEHLLSHMSNTFGRSFNLSSLNDLSSDYYSRFGWMASGEYLFQYLWRKRVGGAIMAHHHPRRS
jgi:hypothetical protein